MQAKSKLMRLIWISLGCIAVVLGMIGIVLPLLPTVPFLLLAAFCFSKSSEKLHDWLMTHPTLGPPIIAWQKHGAISKKAKILAGISLIAIFSISLYMGVSPLFLGIQAVALCCVSLFIFTRPLPPQERKG